MTKLYVVSGFARCGSSLVMQMLAASGLPTVGEWPAFEDMHTSAERIDPAWVASINGRAVKVLDPHLNRLPLPPCDVRAIWCRRDRHQQARSHAKFNRLLFGLHSDREHIRRTEASFAKDEPAAIAALHATAILRMQFEATLWNPVAAATDLAAFCDLPADRIQAMAAAVRDRSPACAPGLEMELALLDERKRA